MCKCGKKAPACSFYQRPECLKIKASCAFIGDLWCLWNAFEEWLKNMDTYRYVYLKVVCCLCTQKKKMGGRRERAVCPLQLLFHSFGILCGLEFLAVCIPCSCHWQWWACAWSCSAAWCFFCRPSCRSPDDFIELSVLTTAPQFSYVPFHSW